MTRARHGGPSCHASRALDRTPATILPEFDAAGASFLAADHNHPSDAGHRAIAQAFAAAVTASAAAQSDPGRHLDAVLRPVAGGQEKGSGLVKFRQPKDGDKLAYLHVSVADLLPNHT